VAPGRAVPTGRLHRTNLSRPAKRVVKFYNERGTAEQHIKEGKNAIRWTRLSCHAFRHNAVRLQLHALAYNLANFLRTLALPQEVEHWSLTTLREKLVKIGARIVRHGRYVVFQLAEVRCRAPCSPRSCAGSMGSDAGRHRSRREHGEQRWQPSRRGAAMLDRELLKRDPSAGRKLENTVLRNHEACPSPRSDPCRLAWRARRWQRRPSEAGIRA
jgi:Transposase DDE domain group 1